MVFPSIPAYFDPSSSQQQQPNPQTGGGTGGNPHLLLPPPPVQTHAGSGGPGSGSIIPGSMAAVKCPRCGSTNTKFCYFNNYSLTQPRYFCKTCRRYWTRCDALRNVPVGGGCRRNKRSKGSSSSKSPVSSGDRQTSSGGSSSAISSNSTGTASLGAEQGIRQTHNPSLSSLIPLIRSLNQFEVNETLFGVKSTFDEEIHTTKLEEGPQMRELEREASRIAGKIEGEETQDLHLAEERGIHLHEKFDIDEETRFSSVFRGVDDSGYDEDEDALLDSCNIETFGGASGSVVGSPLANLTSGKSNDGAPMSSFSSSMDEIQSSLSNTARDVHCSDFNDHSGQLSSESLSKSSALDSESRIQENQFSAQHAGNNYVKEFVEKQMLAEEAQTSKSEDLQPSLRAKKGGSDGGLSANATSYTSTSLGSSKDQEKMSSPSGLTEDAAPVKPQGATESARSHGRPGSSASERGGAASASSAQVLSPSSSMSSLSSEKSTLNPHAKEMPYKGREF